jgi:hypothetical protein
VGAKVIQRLFADTGRCSHSLDLPGRLDRPEAVNRIRNVDVRPRGKQLSEELELPHGEGVPGHAQDTRWGEAVLGEALRDLHDRRQSGLEGERGVPPCARGVLSYEQERLTLLRRIEIGVLGASGEVEEVDPLGDEDAVDPEGDHLALEALDAPLDLHGREPER